MVSLFLVGETISFTATIGFIALVGSEVPLAIVIKGDLVSSALLARLVTPVLYKLLEPEMRPEGAGDVIAAAPEARERQGALAT